MHINPLNCEIAADVREGFLEDLEWIDRNFLPTEVLEIRAVGNLLLSTLDQYALEADEMEAYKLFYRVVGLSDAFNHLLDILPNPSALNS